MLIGVVTAYQHAWEDTTYMWFKNEELVDSDPWACILVVEEPGIYQCIVKFGNVTQVSNPISIISVTEATGISADRKSLHLCTGGSGGGVEHRYIHWDKERSELCEDDIGQTPTLPWKRSEYRSVERAKCCAWLCPRLELVRISDTRILFSSMPLQRSHPLFIWWTSSYMDTTWRKPSLTTMRRRIWRSGLTSCTSVVSVCREWHIRIQFSQWSYTGELNPGT